MNKNTTEAFSTICRNEDVFEFTQMHGLHGVAIQYIDEPEDTWFNPKLVHSLGYNAEQALSWQKIIPPAEMKKFGKFLDVENYYGESISGNISFLHSKGFLIPMSCTAIKVEEELVIALTKVYDYSNIEYNPELDFQREQLLETVLDTINVGVIACDSEGKLILFNKAAKKWHGVAAENIPQSEYARYYNLYEPDGKTLFRTEDIPLINMLQEGVIRKKEMIIKAKKGKERFVVVSGARLYDERNNINGAVVALHNITKRKNAVEKLRISEETFRGSFESAADGMAITDATGTCIEVNDRLCEIMGYSASELKSLNFQEVTYPEDLDEDLKLWNQLLAGEREYYQMEKRAIHKSGKIKHIIVSVAIVRDENNAPFHFITQITDISSLKEAEEELHSTLSQLENLLEASTQVSIIGLDREGVISTFNRGAENLLGYCREEALGKMSFEDLHIADEIQKSVLELSQTYGVGEYEEEIYKLLGEKGRSYTGEWNYICKNGKKLPVQLTITPVYEDKNLTGYLCVATDISDLKAAHSKITSILEITKDQNQRLENFAHIVSHNLRSHSGNIEMLLDIFTEEHPELNENEVVKMVLTASEKLKETIADLNEIAFINLSISKNIGPLNLYNSVDHTLGSINALIKKADMQVFNNIPEDMEVLSVPAYMESIILNFATNALKYRSNERAPFVRFEAVRGNGFIKLSIEDNGIGIDLEKYGEKLFGMYKTFHQNEDARGIGLFITRNQIEAVGGKIEVESEVNKGTIFHIYLKYE